MEISGDLEKKGTHAGRSLPAPFKESATCPQYYPACFEYSPFKINCRKTRIAKTFIRITWQGNGCMYWISRVPVSSQGCWTGGREGDPGICILNKLTRWFCCSENHCSRTWDPLSTYTGVVEVGKETGEERRGVFVAMEERLHSAL